MGIGISYMIVAALMQALVSVIIRYTADVVPVSLQVGCYYVIPFFLFLPFFFKNGPILYKSNKFLLHFIRGLFSISAVGCFFYSVKYIPLGVSTTLFNMIPFFVPLIAYFCLKERINIKTYLGLSVAVPGTLLILNPRFLSFSTLYFIVGLSAAVLMATAMVLLRYLVKEKESVNQIVFNQYSSCSLIALLSIGLEVFLNPHDFKLATHMNARMVSLLIGLGLLSLGIQYCFSKAAQRMEASQFAPFLYLSVPLSSLLGFVIWGQSLSLAMIMGSSLIFAGLCICSLWREKVSVKRIENWPK